LDVPSLLGGSHGAAGIRYTTAKIVLVGESGSGKTGLTERLVHNRAPQRGPSTSGAWSTQWPLEDLPPQPGWEREVWLWDFGGQADQRLIHQLYLDRTALVLLMFNADQESVLTGLREWRQALLRSMARDPKTLLVAGRTDVGFRFDREKVRAFARENNYEYFETSAETGGGIPELRKAMLEKIPWNELTVHNSPALFKRLKDEILKLRDEGHVLVTFRELESVLRLRLPPEVKFSDDQLEAVISLLDGPGVVKELGFGTYILLRPEWINIYAQAVIRTLRAAESGLGCLPASSIVEGKLIFQTKQVGGNEVSGKRLGPADERVVLQAMEQMLLERRLCLRQNGDLVFPSHCGLERPVGPVPPKFFVSYTIRGYLDDIYATLVVKLAHCGAFKLRELWRDAADFETLADRKIVGIKLVRGEDGRGELLAHHARGVTGQEQVIFASYVHEHLSEKSTEEVPRLRFYSCPNCDEPVENRKLAMERLEKDGEQAQIRCQRCDKFIPLWDMLEKRFASQAIRKKVEALRLQESFQLDTRRQGKLLVLEVSARITSANQMCHEIPGDVDEGIDLVVEFTDDEGRATGQHMYLQLKAGNSFLKRRKSDGAEIFTIKKQRWAKYWASQDAAMMLVVGTFPEDPEPGMGSERKNFAEVRWMEIGELLRRESDNGKKPVKQIVFKGERLDAQSVRGWRDRALSGPQSA
jgi:small GTP-binding protein